MEGSQQLTAPSINIFQLLGMLLVLLLILALTYYSTRWIARIMGGQPPLHAGKKKHGISVLNRLILNKGQSIIVVCYDKKHYLLGICDNSITLIDSRSMTEEELNDMASPDKEEAFSVKFSEVFLRQIMRKDESGKKL